MPPITNPPSTTIALSDRTCERHESMDLTDVVFKVRNRMVKVPVQMFSDSETFYAVIKKITSNDEVQSLELEKDDEGDFLHFMKYMITSQPRCEIALDVAAYIPIGKFVTKWGFKSIRADVIREVQTSESTMDVIDKIVFARDCYMLLDGCSEAQPLHILGVEKVDFAPFIETINPRPQAQDFTLPQWISVLKLSTMWEFMGIRQFAIKKLAEFSIQPPQRIQLARDYRIREWLLPALNAYAQRTAPVRIEDVDLLGWQYILKIIQAREEARYQITCWARRSRCKGHGIHCPVEARVNRNFEGLILRAFRDEIERIRLWHQ